MTKLPPSSIIKRSAAVPQGFAVFIFLDGIAYCEVAEYNKTDFEKAYKVWKKDIFPTLANSNVRYFFRTDKAIKIFEGLPTFTKTKSK